MRVIYNKYFPFKPFLATNIFGLVICRGKKGRLSDVDINHEYIHTLQQRELFYIGFMLLYNLEWLYWLCRKRSYMKAYYSISFEREAYDNEKNLNYEKERQRFAWLKILRKTSPIADEICNFFYDIISFIKEDFKPLKFLYIAFFISAIIIGQVHFHIYDILLKPSYADGTSLLRFPLLYCSVYFAILIPTLFIHGEQWRLRQWQAWLFPVLLITINGAGQGFNAYQQWIAESGLQARERYFLFILCSYLIRSVCILFLICCFKWITTGSFGLYGLKMSGKYIRIYLLVFCILLPIFIAVSTTQQFVDYYPKMEINRCIGSFGLERWQLIGIFELGYGNDFLAVESMFRGAMVIGLCKWLGPRTVLPMALTYMCVHLGKPDLELCSSVIGGYTLGVLAYRTQHLWGGIIVHLGIAMLFEMLGLIRLLA